MNTTPKIHLFASTGMAYNACQGDESISKGDILVIESEGVIGIADTWPFALTEKHGALHGIMPGYVAEEMYPAFAPSIAFVRATMAAVARAVARGE